MRMTAQGWSRDHGPTEIFDVDLGGVQVPTGEFTYGPASPALRIDLSRHPSAAGAPSGVTLHCFAPIHLNGDYNVKISITRQEIARLFCLTYQREIDRFLGLFPRQDHTDQAA